MSEQPWPVYAVILAICGLISFLGVDCARGVNESLLGHIVSKEYFPEHTSTSCTPTVDADGDVSISCEDVTIPESWSITIETAEGSHSVNEEHATWDSLTNNQEVIAVYRRGGFTKALYFLRVDYDARRER